VIHDDSHDEHIEDMWTACETTILPHPVTSSKLEGMLEYCSNVTQLMLRQRKTTITSQQLRTVVQWCNEIVQLVMIVGSSKLDELTIIALIVIYYCKSSVSLFLWGYGYVTGHQSNLDQRV